MRLFRNATRGTVLSAQTEIADNILSRLCGLLFRATLAEGDGLYLVPCKTIHMFWMRFAIDCVFIDNLGQVVGLVERIQPGRISPCFTKAHGCLELSAGTIANSGTYLGDIVEIE